MSKTFATFSTTIHRRLLESALALRRNNFVAAAYGLLPRALREFLGVVAWRKLWAGMRFPALPECSVAATSPGEVGRHARSRVNVFGFFGGQFGLGESARLYASALADSGVSIAVLDVDLGLPHSRQAYQRYGAPNPCIDAVDLVVVNPDYLDRALPQIDALGKDRRMRVGCWFWELDTVPDRWHGALRHIDAILVSSEFIERAVAKVTDKPILRVPLPLRPRVDSGLGREAFGLSREAFIFLCSLDFHSSIYRKNPSAVISAFCQAFPRRDENVQVIIKSINGTYYPAQFAELIEAAKADQRVLIRDQAIAAPHMRALQRCCDAYVSLHRSEGFGLGLAECMELAKPVIGTAWSGNMEFMNDENSCLVDAVTIPVIVGQYQDAPPGSVWAEPDVRVAADWMRKLVSDPEFARKIGERAAADVEEKLSPRRVAAELMCKITALNALAPLADEAFL